MEIKAGHGIGLLLTLILIVLIFLYVLPFTGNLLYSLLVNTVVGFIVIVLVNTLFGLGIRYDALVLVFVAVFGFSTFQCSKDHFPNHHPQKEELLAKVGS